MRCERTKRRSAADPAATFGSPIRPYPGCIWNWHGEGKPSILTHLSPVNPTFVNGAPVAEPRALHNGDIIEVANGVALRVELFDSGDKEVTQFRGRDVRRMYAILSADVRLYEAGRARRHRDSPPA